MPEQARSIAELLFPGDEPIAAYIEPIVSEETALPSEGVFVAPLVEQGAQTITAQEEPMFIATHSEQSRTPFYRRRSILVLAAAGVAVAVLASNTTRNSDTDRSQAAPQPKPSATAVPSNSPNTPPFASSTPKPSPTPSSTIPVNNYPIAPIVFGSEKDHTVRTAHAEIGPFKVLFSYQNQLHELSFPGGTAGLVDRSANVLYTEKHGNVDTKTNAVQKTAVIKTASITHGTIFNVPYKLIGDRIISNAAQITAQGDKTWCTAYPDSCTKAANAKTTLTPTRLQSVKSSIEVLALYAAQKQCSSYASSLLLANINASEDNYATKLHISPDDFTVVYDSKSPFNYISKAVATQKANGAVTTIKSLQAAFGNQISIPITCKP